MPYLVNALSCVARMPFTCARTFGLFVFQPVALKSFSVSSRNVVTSDDIASASFLPAGSHGSADGQKTRFTCKRNHQTCGCGECEVSAVTWENDFYSTDARLPLTGIS